MHTHTHTHTNTHTNTHTLIQAIPISSRLAAAAAAAAAATAATTAAATTNRRSSSNYSSFICIYGHYPLFIRQCLEVQANTKAQAATTPRTATEAGAAQLPLLKFPHSHHRKTKMGGGGEGGRFGCLFRFWRASGAGFPLASTKRAATELEGAQCPFVDDSAFSTLQLFHNYHNSEK